MRPDDQRRDGQGGGIPDGLLIGILAFLLGMTLLVWTATGLAALFAHGSWPAGVTFSGTPLAMRHLVAEPHDIPGAWPDAPASALSGYGLFWGLFIGQLMVLVVLTVFVMGTFARWRAVRQRRRAEAEAAVVQEPTAAPTPAQEPEQVHEVPTPRAPRQTAPAPAPAPAPTDDPLASVADGKRVGGWETPRAEGAIHYGPPTTRHETAANALREAEGAALVITSNPALWSDTKDARAKLGPCHLYDPGHLCDTPARVHWSPTTGCEDRPTATARAAALLAPVRPTSRLDQAVGDTAELLLRSYLHAAAIDGRTVRHVHRWSQGLQIQDAVRVLRTNPKAAPGAAGELEGALTAHPDRRDMAQQLTSRALAALSTVNIREACTPNRTDALALDSFVHEQGTLYVVGESIEDPRTSPGAMPLLTALVSSVVESGRRMAERSSSGRLDPPLTLVLDDVAAVAPLPQLPELLADGAERGLPTLALLRSREQGRARWPHDELPV
ncbi:type IV secretory system conjugative DNA transfer family protein [Streptomyces sp. MA25(2023)]|uniref:type IV secretory system conjugative DNA transfer family protein n=1 Tax=Streptomyces sp. MA25(2023) TaxID=3055078 RepID=UPI0025B1DACB|nr:type IV secretory system conjugative DNA transfer family protein [Streptomyces sp. MA25(2023)]MDN3253719.1 type IV secretory system conjugative DNA transfer family protein [Streptomyces sp. MA25(2023)]